MVAPRNAGVFVLRGGAHLSAQYVCKCVHDCLYDFLISCTFPPPINFVSKWWTVFPRKVLRFPDTLTVERPSLYILFFVFLIYVYFYE